MSGAGIVVRTCGLLVFECGFEWIASVCFDLVCAVQVLVAGYLCLLLSVFCVLVMLWLVVFVYRLLCRLAVSSLLLVLCLLLYY